MKKLIIDSINANIRLDKLSSDTWNISRNLAKELILDGHILVNGRTEKPKYLVLSGDVVTYEEQEPKPIDLEPENLGIKVIYEDDDVAVVYKPEGMVVHPAVGNTNGTLVNGLLYEMDFKDTINDVIRPGIVHRIDKDTSGLLMIAKNDLAVESLSNQLREHSCNRTYIALVYGEISENEGRIIAPIGRDPIDRKKMAVVPGGKESITNFRVLERFKGFTLVECRLETGRTHQIRVHMKYIGHPLVGDKVYGPKHVIGDKGQFLHAKTIGFIHPRTKEHMEFTSELPDYFIEMINELREKSH